MYAFLYILMLTTLHGKKREKESADNKLLTEKKNVQKLSSS
jgi:hypothetical protein